MGLIHAAIGVGEAVITGLVLRFVLLTRPDLIAEPATSAPSRVAGLAQVAAVGLAVALAVVVFLGPLASESPDGLEFVGAKLGLRADDAPAWLPAPLADYGRTLGIATALAGLIGTLVVFGVGFVLARTFVGSRPLKEAPEPLIATSAEEVAAHHAA